MYQAGYGQNGSGVFRRSGAGFMPTRADTKLVKILAQAQTAMRSSQRAKSAHKGVRSLKLCNA